jgi:hypothetical protein
MANFFQNKNFNHEGHEGHEGKAKLQRKGREGRKGKTCQDQPRERKVAFHITAFDLPSRPSRPSC